MNKPLKFAFISLLSIMMSPSAYSQKDIDSNAYTEKFSEYSSPKSFISAKQLSTLIDNKEDLVVIGVLNPSKDETPINGSYTLWRPDYSAKAGTYQYEGMRNSNKEMEQILNQFGATPESTIIVYASKLHHDAGRLFWQLKKLTHNDVRYLDGGLEAWKEAGFSNLTLEQKSNNSSPNYHSSNYDISSLADIKMVINAINNDDWVIIDTRTEQEYNGDITKKGAYGPGRIPGSIHINWSKALDKNNKLKSANKLKALYQDTIKNKKVIVYCQSGVRSAHTTLVLKDILGAKNVYNYDGSWVEWSYEYYQNRNPLVQIEAESDSKS